MRTVILVKTCSLATLLMALLFSAPAAKAQQDATTGKKKKVVEKEYIISVSVDDEGNMTTDTIVHEQVRDTDGDGVDEDFIFLSKELDHVPAKKVRVQVKEEGAAAEELEVLTKQMKLTTGCTEGDSLKERQQIIMLEKNPAGDFDTLVFIDNHSGELSDEDLELLQKFGHKSANDFWIETEEEEATNGKKSVQRKVVKVEVLITEPSDAEKALLEESTHTKVDKSTGLMINQLRFSPNPNNGQFNLQFNLPEKGRTTITLTNLNGKVVFEERLRNFSGPYNKTIDITDKAKGVYLLQIRQNGRAMTKKIAVQ